MAMQTWTVKISIDNTWIQDGYDLTARRLKDNILNDLSYADDSEVRVKVLQAPDPEKIAKIQGFKSAAEMTKNDSEYDIDRSVIA